MARPKLGDSESKRLQMIITEDELNAIDDWQFANRIANRSEAVRRLCQVALALEPLIEKNYSLTEDVLKSRYKSWDRLTDILDEIRFPEHAIDEQTPTRDAVRAISDLCSDVLSSQSEHELFLTAATMREMLNEIKSGDKIEASIAQVKETIARLPRLVNFSSREPKP